MEREMILNMLKFRSLLQQIKIIGPVRYYSNMPARVTPRRIKTSEKDEEESRDIFQPPSFGGVQVKYWNESSAIKKEKRANRFPHNINNFTDAICFFQNWNNFPGGLDDLKFYFKRKWTRKQLIEQKYLPQRVAVLKPDLAAAHFLVRRHGHVKFVGSQEWVGISGEKKSLPLAYIPGMFIEAIKAEGTNLIFEGLENLKGLRHLTSLSLRNLENINDWCLDYISKEHYLNLEDLDISGCKNVTYRGLSCFYRYENLKTLNVEGIPDPPEFKVACLMLLEIMPHLEINGIDLSIPEKIDPVNLDLLKDKTDSEIAV